MVSGIFDTFWNIRYLPWNIRYLSWNIRSLSWNFRYMRVELVIWL